MSVSKYISTNLSNTNKTFKVHICKSFNLMLLNLWKKYNLSETRRW